MTATQTFPGKLASEAQMGFIKRLVNERQLDAENERLVQGCRDLAAEGNFMSRHAITMIDILKRLPMKASATAVTTAGFFRTPDGEIFFVKPNREKTRVYANRLVEFTGDRLTEEGETVHFEFDYTPGAIYKLTEDMRLPLAEGVKLTLRYGRCLCGRQLKNAKSVELGIGPVCRSYYR